MKAFARAALVAAFLAEAGLGGGLAGLRVLEGGYPRAFFFRAAEGFAANPRWDYVPWEGTFARLMGIEGKALDEEVPGRGLRNAEFFSRFKRAHPDQLVLLHYNGNARDPRFQTEKYFAGHWLYYEGAKVASDVPAEAGETEIRVSDATLFRTGIGRYRQSNEDIGLCVLDAEGKPDWGESEQVQLVAVDVKGRTIRVRRGCYGTKPRAFPAGRAYAAAHAHEGPWGRRSHLMWFYNYSTRCPRDAAGRRCGDVHAEELAARFAPGGRLAAFDGLEFDVLHHRHGGRGRRAYDCDADGLPDNGVFDGVNTYGVGVVEFCRKLRARMGEERLILADGMGLSSQRAFGILNGIESEGWPHLSDWAIRDWSGGLNRHFFWAANGRKPVFNYVNHKFVTRGDEPGVMKRPEVPWGVHRLVFAASVFTDSAICYSFVPPGEAGERFGVWDELRKGTEHVVGWLGRPVGPAVRLAMRQPDLLRNEGPKRVRAAKAIHRSELRFRLDGVPCRGQDLFVAVTARAEPLAGCPKEVARLMWVGIAAPSGNLTTADLPDTGMCLRDAKEAAIDPDTGASVRWMPKRRLGGESHNAYFVHPPWRDRKTGFTFWERTARVPEGGRLDFFLGMAERSPGRSDGVAFRVLVAPADGGAFETVFEHTQKAARWTRHTAPLAKWAGKEVRLRFVSDCGPKDDSTTDHSLWGDVWLVGQGGRVAATPPVRFMTWAGGEPSTSGFYFSDIRSGEVDLEILVEGKEAVTISAVTAHASPDVMVREFEHGVAVANPSPRPYAFDLGKLFGGKAFRRLRGSSRQDPKTNNGEPVRGTLTLGPREGLFLVREE